MKKWEEAENKKYSALYADGYPAGLPEHLISWAAENRDQSILDLGCGRAKLSRMFNNYAGVDISEYVIGLNKKNYPNKDFFHCPISDAHKILSNRHFDIVCCPDVMEHIPEEEVLNTIKSISLINGDRYYFGISTRSSVLLADDGSNLHLTIWNKDQWIEAISKYLQIDKSEYFKSKDLLYVKGSRIV